MNLFASLEQLSEQEQVDGRTRAFEGTGTPFLPVPGLLKLDGLRLRYQEFPLSEVRRYPVDSNLSQSDGQTHPTVDLQLRADGTPVLVRSVLSNDGIWQKGVPIYVTGDWKVEEESVVAGEEFPSAAAEALSEEPPVTPPTSSRHHQPARAAANHSLAP